MQRWRDVQFEPRMDPFYSVLSPHGHEVMETEYQARLAGFFVPTGMWEPPQEWFVSDDERVLRLRGRQAPLATSKRTCPAASPASEKRLHDTEGEDSRC